MNYANRKRTYTTPTNPPRHGSMIVLTAISMVIMLFFAALLVDVAWMASIHSEAQLVSDIATRGALTSYVNEHSEDSYEQRVARAQLVGETIFENIIIGGSTIDVDPKSFQFGVRGADGTFTTSNIDSANAINLNLPNIQPDGFGLFLAPLLGIDTFNTSPSSTAAYQPIDVVLCLDISRSMAWRLDANEPPTSVGTIDAPPVPGSRWLAAVDSVNTFLKKAEINSPSLRVSLVTLGGGVRQSVTTPWDNEHTRVQNEFEFIGAARGEIDASLNLISANVLAWQTPTKETLELTQSVFKSDSLENTNRICILLSDGLATTGSPDAAAASLGADGITIHTIYFAGDPRGIDQLQNIAIAGGGLALKADDATELNNAFNRILSLISVSIVE